MGFSSAKVSKFTRVLVYDRASLGKSDVSNNPMNSKQSIENLYTLINTGEGGHEGFSISLDQIRVSRKSFGNLPLSVISAGLIVHYHSEESFRIWHELQRDLLKLSTNSTQIIAERSNHDIIKLQPELVVQVIKDMINRMNVS